MPVGQDGAILLTPEELRVLGVKIGDTVDVHYVGGLVEVTPVDEFSDLNIDQLLELVDARS